MCFLMSFILKIKTIPINNYYRFSSQTVSNKYGPPNSSLTQKIHIAHTYLFINKFSDNLICIFPEFNTLCGNEFSWRLKIYKDYLETPGNIFNMSCLQNAVTAVFKHEQEWQDQEEIGKLPTHF